MMWLEAAASAEATEAAMGGVCYEIFSKLSKLT